MKFSSIIMNTILRHLNTITMLKVVSRARIGHNDIVVIRDISGKHYVISVTGAEEPRMKCPDKVDELLRMNDRNE